MKRRKIISSILVVLSIAAVFTGCQSKASSASSSGDSKSTPKKIIIGTGNNYKPYCFLDEKNNLTGFEIETLKKIDEKLPQYEFEFKVFDFNAILVSLETGKVDLAAHQFEINNDRKAKFLFGDVGLTTYDLKLVVKENREDVKSLKDLADKNATVQGGSASSNATYVLDKWNKENGEKLKLVISPGDTALTLQNLESGKIDAFVNIQRNVDDYKKTYSAKIKTVGDPISYSNSYYLYRKDDSTGTQLKKDVDEEIKQLKQDGTLLKLSQQWLGGDYVAK